jgi:hypothetical protein
MDFIPQFFDLGGTIRVRHFPRQFGQLFSGQLPLARQLKSELNQPSMLRAGQMFDFLNDDCGGHDKNITAKLNASKRLLWGYPDMGTSAHDLGIDRSAAVSERPAAPATWNAPAER